MQAHHPTPEVERRLEMDERSGRSGERGIENKKKKGKEQERAAAERSTRANSVRK
jgi:hypothetical protein